MYEYRVLVPNGALLSYIHPSLACAIGALTTSWTLAEALSELLLTNCLGLDDDIGGIVTTTLGNVTRIQIIENLAQYEQGRPKLREHVLHGAKLFNRNRENRNTVIHALVDGTLIDGQHSVSVRPA